MNGAMACSTRACSWYGPDLVRRRSDVRVHERGRLPRQQQGPLGDPAGLPRLQVTADHPPPHPREAVAQLEGLPDIRLPRIGGQAEGGGELGDRELRHQRRTRTGQRHPLVAVPDQHLRLVDRVGRVHRRPRPRRACSSRASAASAIARPPARAASTAPAVSSSIASAAISESKHRPPTLRPRKPLVLQGCGQLSREILRTATTAVDPSTPQGRKQPGVVRRPKRRATA